MDEVELLITQSREPLIDAERSTGPCVSSAMRTGGEPSGMVPGNEQPVRPRPTARVTEMRLADRDVFMKLSKSPSSVLFMFAL
jgi:hypothetical protein